MCWCVMGGSCRRVQRLVRFASLFAVLRIKWGIGRKCLVGSQADMKGEGLKKERSRHLGHLGTAPSRL